MPRSSPRRASSSKAIIFAMGVLSSDWDDRLCVERGARDGRPATLRRSHRPDLALCRAECQAGLALGWGECKRPGWARARSSRPGQRCGRAGCPQCASETAGDPVGRRAPDGRGRAPTPGRRGAADAGAGPGAGGGPRRRRRAAAVRQLGDGRLRGARRRRRRGDAAPVELPVAADIPAGRTDVPPLDARHRAPDHDRRPDAGRRGRGGAGRADRRRRPSGCGSTRRPRPAQHVRRAGEDVAAGDVVLPAGHGARPGPDRARRGRRRRRRSRCAAGRGCWCSPPAPSWSRRASRCAPGQIYESNGPMLAAAVERRGRSAPSCCASCPTTSTQFLGDARRARLARRPVDLVADLGRGQRGGLRGGQGRASPTAGSSSSRSRCSRAGRRARARLDGPTGVSRW